MTTTRTLFYELIERVGIDGDPVGTAAKIMADLKLNARQKEALGFLVVDECERAVRTEVRAAESSVNWRMANGNGPHIDMVSLRQNLLGRTFALGDGKRVFWFEASIEEHEARIVMLEKMRDGIDETIRGHRAAVEECRRHGVTRLADIPDTAAA